MLLYLLESALCIALLYSVYWLFLRRDTFFILNRTYLLGITAFSLIFPLVPFHFTASGTAATVVYLLDPVLITPEKVGEAVTSHLQWMQIAGIVYITGLAIFLVRFAVQLIQLYLIVRRSGIERREGMRLVFVDRGYSPFSFFNLVFINEKNISDDRLQAILTHEKVHVRQRHTLDLILSELLCIVQWFNPFAWLTGREMKAVHEFLADEGVLTAGISPSQYQQMILDESMGIQVNGLTNNFNVSLLKKRILMISKTKSKKRARVKMILVVPAIMVLVFLLSARSFSGSPGTQDKTTSKVTASPQATTSPTAKPQAEEKIKYTKAEPGKIYDSVEVMPEFPGGFNGLGQFILANLKYPEAAIKNGTQGKVIVSFVVWKDGAVGNVKVMRGIGSGCDEEALRVVSKMPKWKPGMKDGKAVNVHFALPLQFKLDADKKEAPKK